MTDVERLLTAELDDLGDRAPHDTRPAGSGTPPGARRQLAVLASALAVLVLVAGGAVAATRLRPSAAPTRDIPRPRRRPPSGAPCRSRALCRTGPGPASAPRTPGFRWPTAIVGLMLAILFGTPLTAPPAADHNNKILWVAKVGAEGAFSIDARLEGSDRRFQREIGPAPGPSIVDLPAAGCWHLELRWGSYTGHDQPAHAPG